MTGNIKYCGVFENADIPVLILLTGGFVIQGATEEILCRGIVLHTVKEKTSVRIAVVVSTVTFIIPHWSSLFTGNIIYGIIGIANLIFISIIFSLLTFSFKNIWAACGLHSFWNAFLYNFLGLNLSGNDSKITAVLNMQSAGKNIWNGGEYGIEASIITTVVLTAATILIWFANQKQR